MASGSGHVRAGKAEVRAEVEAAGFRFVEEVTIPGFHENYFPALRAAVASGVEGVAGTRRIRGNSRFPFPFSHIVWMGC
ncbi:MAG: hypothetical protein R3E96_02960 [Planctomycetota bacterium]